MSPALEQAPTLLSKRTPPQAWLGSSSEPTTLGPVAEGKEVWPPVPEFLPPPPVPLSFTDASPVARQLGGNDEEEATVRIQRAWRAASAFHADIHQALKPVLAGQAQLQVELARSRVSWALQEPDKELTVKPSMLCSTFSCREGSACQHAGTKHFHGSTTLTRRRRAAALANNSRVRSGVPLSIRQRANSQSDQCQVGSASVTSSPSSGVHQNVLQVRSPAASGVSLPSSAGGAGSVAQVKKDVGRAAPIVDLREPVRFKLVNGAREPVYCGR